MLATFTFGISMGFCCSCFIYFLLVWCELLVSVLGTVLETIESFINHINFKHTVNNFIADFISSLDILLETIKLHYWSSNCNELLIHDSAVHGMTYTNTINFELLPVERAHMWKAISFTIWTSVEQSCGWDI